MLTVGPVARRAFVALAFHGKPLGGLSELDLNKVVLGNAFVVARAQADPTVCLILTLVDGCFRVQACNLD